MFIARNLVADRVNLHQNAYASGLPSPLAFLGMVGAVAHDLDCDPHSVRVLPIIHQVHQSPGRTKPEQILKSRRFTNAEIIEDAIGTVEFSLAFDIPQVFNEKSVQRSLSFRRLAGGLLRSIEFSVEITPGDAQSLSKLPRGNAFVPALNPEHRKVSRGDRASLQAVADVLYPAEREKDRGWLVPAAVGYHLIEDPRTALPRKNTRDEITPHVFAEPVVGVAEMISVRRNEVRRADGQAFNDLFWSWATEPGSRFVMAHKLFD